MSHAYYDNHFLLNALMSLWNAEIRAYAIAHGQVQCALIHLLTWGLPVLGSLLP